MLRLAVAILLIAPVAIAASSLPEAIQGEDTAGDVHLYGPDGVDLGTTDQFPRLDILAATVEKGTEGIRFTIEVADAQGLMTDPPDNSLDARVGIHFLYGDVHYLVDFADTPGDGCLVKILGDAGADTVIVCPPAQLDGKSVSVDIPSKRILSQSGAELRHPAQVDSVWAEATQETMLFFEEIGYLTASDRGPDQGVWGSLLTPVDSQAGPLLVTPLQSVRDSNGGPDVLVFPVDLDNVQEEDLYIHPVIDGLPAGWSATLPGQVLVSAENSTTIAAAVTITATHQHGELVPFSLRLLTPSGQELSATELGVQFLATPQPAGHHPTVYLHSNIESGTIGPSFYSTWMNTLLEDDFDDGDPAPAFRSTVDGVTRTSIWKYELFPILSIGLDFDTQEPVEAIVPVSVGQDTSAEVTFALRHCDPSDTSGLDVGDYRCNGSWFDLATTTRSVDLSQGVSLLEWDIPVETYADHVPYEKDALLTWFMQATYMDSPLAQMRIEPGGSMHLPLHEYLDPIDNAFLGTPELELDLLGATDRRVQAGQTNYFQLELSNTAPQVRDAVVKLDGVNLDWATVEPSRIRLGPQETATLFVTVTAPDDARPNDFSEIIVAVHDDDDDSLLSMQMIRSTVDPEAPLEERPAGLNSTQGAPGIQVVAVLAGLLVVGATRRCH